MSISEHSLKLNENPEFSLPEEKFRLVSTLNQPPKSFLLSTDFYHRSDHIPSHSNQFHSMYKTRRLQLLWGQNHHQDNKIVSCLLSKQHLIVSNVILSGILPIPYQFSWQVGNDLEICKRSTACSSGHLMVSVKHCLPRTRSKYDRSQRRILARAISMHFLLFTITIKETHSHVHYETAKISYRVGCRFSCGGWIQSAEFSPQLFSFLKPQTFSRSRL